MEFIRDAKTVAPEKPFFLYYAPGAAHAPHHAPKEWIERDQGRFDMGYEAIREQILARQKELGIVRPHRLPPINPIGTPQNRTGPDGKPFPIMDFTQSWDSLSDDEKHLFCRMAEVYAGFLSHADDQIGRLLDYLEEYGLRDNTMGHRRLRQRRLRRGWPQRLGERDEVHERIPDDMAENLSLIDDLGSPRTYNHYPNGWAMAFNTPFKMWKRYEFEVAPPIRASSPGRRASRRPVRSVTSTTTRFDLVPTILDVLNVEPPAAIKGHTQSDFDGVSMRYSFDDDAATSHRRTQFYSMLGSRAIWHDGWKAVSTHPAISGWSNFNEDVWELL